MKNIFTIIVIVVFWGCSNANPISGCYQTKDKEISATILDSSLFLMIGVDTMIIYDLKYFKEFNFDTTIYRFYNVLFSNTLNSNGYETFDIPVHYRYDSSFGGVLMAEFINEDFFTFGGYNFYRVSGSESEQIFNKWNDLYLHNLQTKLYYKN